MEDQNQNYTSQQSQQTGYSRYPAGGDKGGIQNIVKKSGLLLVAVILFGSGWLVGEGKVSLNTAEQLASVVSDESPSDISTDGLQELYDVLRKNYDGDIDAEALVDGLKKGAVAAVGDTYTEYLPPEEAKAFQSSLEGKFDGIGAELSKEGSFIVIISPIKGTPADRAGIQPKDIIIEIDGESATDINVSEAVSRIRGEKGTEVRLTIIRNGEQIEVPIIRDTIDIPSVEWSIEGDVGIISISSFNEDTTSLTVQAARDMLSKNIQKVILDVRGNPGGFLDQAVGVANVWLEKDSVILEEKRDGQTIQTFTSPDVSLLSGVKTVVLINGGSASASEIVAGALKDNNAATLLGETSFGKGSVQQIIKLDGGGALKVTIARWYTPNGKNIDKEGIDPDTAVERTSEDIQAGRDPQMDKAKELLK